MQLIKTVDEMREWRAAFGGMSVGLVPTMGYLHEGHLSLVRGSMCANEQTVVSVFVNAAQFGPNEDLDEYPRDLDRDSGMLGDLGVDVLFAPSDDAMYPTGYATYVSVDGPVTERLCGASRPGHFRGVTTVVYKLFNVVRPKRAYFGEKDAQQLAVIRRMVDDLNIPVEVIGCPIVRSEDGLALSSRNAYMTDEERRQALSLSQALKRVKKRAMEGVRDVGALRDELTAHFDRFDRVEPEYIEFVEPNTMEPVGTLKGDTLVAIAAVVSGKVRLIDNIRLDVGALEHGELSRTSDGGD